MPRHGIKTIAKKALARDSKTRKALYGKEGIDSTKSFLKTTQDGMVSDSFQNFAQNMGIGADNPLSTASYGFNPITRIRPILEFIHRGSWLGAVAVDLKADDMTRAGVEIGGAMSPEDMGKVEAEVRRLGVWHSLNSTVKWAKLYGGAVAYMMIDGQDPATPLRVDTITKGQFRGILSLDRWMIEPSLQDLVTEEGKNLGKPKYYTINAMSPALPRVKFHHTRCIRLVGIELPYWQAMTENLWGISVLERVYDRMVAYDSASTGVAQLMYKTHLRTMKIPGLRELVAAGGRAYQGLIAQINIMRRFQNQEAISLIDDKDTLETQSTAAVSGMSEALGQFGQQFSGAVQIPQTRLFGQSPAGFNSGDNDLRMYYDSILQEQNRDLLEGTTTCYKLATLSLGMQLDPDFSVAFRSLWQMTEKEKAEVGEIVGRTVGAALDSGIITPQTAGKELKQASKETGVFSNITDEDINALSDEPPPTAEEAMQQQQEAAAAGGAPGGEGSDKTPGGKPGAPTLDSTMGPDGYQEGEWVRLDLTTQPKSALLQGGIPRSRSQGPSVRVVGYSGGKYTLVDENGYRFRASVSELSPPRNKPVKDSALGSVIMAKRLCDLDIVIENPRGSMRAGVGDDGKPFENVMPADYGYISRVVGDDNAQMDVIVGGAFDANKAHVIYTKHPVTNQPDEQKVMLFFRDAADAMKVFMDMYSDGGGWQRFEGMVPMTLDQLHAWLDLRAGVSFQTKGVADHAALKKPFPTLQ